MKKLLEFLWTGCWHHWAIYERKHVQHKGIILGEAVFCHCTKCGMPKRFNLYETPISA